VKKKKCFLDKPPAFDFKNGDDIKYEIVWKKPAKRYNAHGICDEPAAKNPQIWVDPKLKEKKLLSVIIEELYHAFAFEKNEKTARGFASTVKKLLYKLGWKRIDTT